MRCQWLVGVALFGAIVLSGCAQGRAYKSYSDEVNSWSYPKTFVITWKDWALDLLDIPVLEIGAGETIGIDLQPTELLQTGFLYGDVMKVGWRQRAFGVYRQIHQEIGASWVYYRDTRLEPAIGTPSLFDRPKLFKGFPIRFNDEYHWMDIRAEVGFIFGQVNAGVSPKEALDFTLTTLQLPINLLIRWPLAKAGFDMPDVDIMEDDTRAHIRKKYDVTLVKEPEMFEPTETLNDLIKLPY